MRISVDHAQMISDWGKKAFEMDTATETLRVMIETNYIVNVREFELLGPELQYHLQCGLEASFKATFIESNYLLERRQHPLSPEEKELMRLRRNISAKVARAFQPMKRDFFPELASRLIAPTIIPIVASQIIVPEINVPEFLDAATPSSPSNACSIREEEEDDDSEVFDDIGPMHRLNLSDCQIIYLINTSCYHLLIKYCLTCLALLV
jgi:hypothetical protein